MHELIQSEIQSDIISEKKFVTSGTCVRKCSVSVPFREIYPTEQEMVCIHIYIAKARPTMLKHLSIVLHMYMHYSTCMCSYIASY